MYATPKPTKVVNAEATSGGMSWPPYCFNSQTIIIVTHELESAFSVADRITVMDKGQQIMTGTKEEVRASTDTRIVNMLARKARDEEIDGDAYLKRLTDTLRVK